jgi:hypothetical protein
VEHGVDGASLEAPLAEIRAAEERIRLFKPLGR